MAAALTACSPDTKLKDLSNATMAVKLSPSTLTIYVHPRDERASTGGDRERKLSTNARAWFNGLPLKRLTGIYAFGSLTTIATASSS